MSHSYGAPNSQNPCMGARPLVRKEIEALADEIAGLLADPDAKLAWDTRLRWEGALTVLERILGRAPTLSPDPSGDFSL